MLAPVSDKPRQRQIKKTLTTVFGRFLCGCCAGFAWAIWQHWLPNKYASTAHRRNILYAFAH